MMCIYVWVHILMHIYKMCLYVYVYLYSFVYLYECGVWGGDILETQSTLYIMVIYVAIS